LLPQALGASFLCLLAPMRAGGGEIIFTNDTLIATGTTNYEGQDIVIQSCMVTVQGTHSFNSVQVAGTLTLVGGSTLNVADTLAVHSRVVCWYTNTTGQVSNQLAGVGVTINASNVVVDASASIITWDQPYLPWVRPFPPWNQPIRVNTAPAAFPAPGLFGAGRQTLTNAVRTH
jgi:hypothetical protein